MTLEPATRKHSGLGIASFVIGLTCAVLTLLVFGIAGYVELTTPGGMQETDVAAMLVGLFMFFIWFCQLVGIGLGLAGCFERERRRLYAILGLAFNGGMLLFSLVLVLIGLGMS